MIQWMSHIMNTFSNSFCLLYPKCSFKGSKNLTSKVAGFSCEKFSWFDHFYVAMFQNHAGIPLIYISFEETITFSQKIPGIVQDRHYGGSDLSCKKLVSPKIFIRSEYSLYPKPLIPIRHWLFHGFKKSAISPSVNIAKFW